ncbi:hypothetical protein [Peribacillus simplex]|uniref:hypothetical protein n=1 Tax=Peribacillus simplex TaxID=1478 RepID=UPI003D08D48B
MNLQKPKISINISDIGVLFSAAAVVGYGIYYVYATSYNQYYELPMNFVELKMENLSFVIVLTVLAMGFLLVIPDYCKFIFENNPHLNTKKELFQKVLLIITIVGVLSLFGLELPQYSLEMAFLVIFIFMTIYWRLDNKLPPRLTISICILLVGGLSVMFGSFSAAEKDSYLIMDSANDQSFVIIKTFQDKFIIAPVNLHKKEITPRFQFIDMNSKEEYALVHTGKLKVKKVTAENMINDF